MMIHEITEKAGAHRARKRVGRGRASGVGKTAGRGHKGAGSRSGSAYRPYFEGGQMPFARRIPKRGFSNDAFRTDYHIVNVKMLERRFDAGAEVDAAELVRAGIVRDTKRPVKILGEGELTKKLSVTADRFSAGARAKIEAAGGVVNELPRMKWTRTGPVPRPAGKPQGRKGTKGTGGAAGASGDGKRAAKAKAPAESAGAAESED